MNQIYGILNTILPFGWLEYDFMKNALLAVLLITPVFGILGTIIVNNRMAFFSDALGHGAFTGIAIGSVIGLVRPAWSAVIFSIGFSVLITIIKNRTKTSTDTVIGVFSSAAIAVGLVLVTSGGYSYNSYLVGDLLSIAPAEIGALFLLAVLIILLWLVFYNKVLMVSVNISLAKSRGINTLAVELAFTAIIAVAVTIVIQWVGLLIVNSLLVLPAAAARNVSNNARQYNASAIMISVFSGVLGLVLSYYMDTATGATIVIISAVIYFITLAMRKRFA
ncbi:high-affinity zinc uptake system membrane protein ZnuB [Ruminiclostridium hungatei]|uniref:High-affinity zinc uptake system membrane protein ZnuB n=1 Tax=Ruminiclostridium hungatei TaxID=48256 RepID=A0A1V4SI93_RUMHU|nr:metal ABC transporter permease [Ruminiclostridium hungatei]OPX43609.1 high-affinity zinc uptake system membrane protein ZnuB [Ruminiclostridium hungatei]